jgi:hypothetical protein
MTAYAGGTASIPRSARDAGATDRGGGHRGLLWTLVSLTVVAVVVASLALGAAWYKTTIPGGCSGAVICATVRPFGKTTLVAATITNTTTHSVRALVLRATPNAPIRWQARFVSLVIHTAAHRVVYRGEFQREITILFRIPPGEHVRLSVVGYPRRPLEVGNDTIRGFTITPLSGSRPIVSIHTPSA